MTDYSRGYAAGLKAAAEYAATHTGSDSPVFRDTVTATETIRFAYQWQRAVYAGILSLPIEGEADQRGAAAEAFSPSGSQKHTAQSAPHPASQPEGVVVPREPTRSMLVAGVKSWEGPAAYKVISNDGLKTAEDDVRLMYSAMLAAAKEEHDAHH